MKIMEYRFKLKDVRPIPFEEGDYIENMNDVMYLYYTIKVKNSHNEIIEISAYDYPCIQDLGKMYNDLFKMDVIKFPECEYKVNMKVAPWGMDHSIRLEKFNEHYNLYLYEEFGSSIVLDYLTEKELCDMIKYIDRKISKAINKYNRGRYV